MSQNMTVARGSHLPPPDDAVAARMGVAGYPSSCMGARLGRMVAEEGRVCAWVSSPPLLLTLDAPPPSHFCPPSLLPHIPPPIPLPLRLSTSFAPPFFLSNESPPPLPSAACFLYALPPGIPLLPLPPQPPPPRSHSAPPRPCLCSTWRVREHKQQRWLRWEDEDQVDEKPKHVIGHLIFCRATTPWRCRWGLHPTRDRCFLKIYFYDLLCYIPVWLKYVEVLATIIWKRLLEACSSSSCWGGGGGSFGVGADPGCFPSIGPPKLRVLCACYLSTRLDLITRRQA